jgi:hypothetical protein
LKIAASEKDEPIFCKENLCVRSSGSNATDISQAMSETRKPLLQEMPLL